jgi:hypothetical protein
LVRYSELIFFPHQLSMRLYCVISLRNPKAMKNRLNVSH